MTQTMRLTEGEPSRVLTRFAAPIFLSQLFQQLYNSVDSLIVGNFLGKEALAAVSSSGALSFLLISFITGTTLGAGVVIARHFGAGDDRRVDRAIHTTVCAGLIAGTAVTLIGVFLTPTFLRWMGTAEEVMDYSVLYFRCYFLGGVAVVMYNVFRDIMTALGDSRRPLIYLMISSCLNVVLDLLFIAVFGFGVGSAAVATVISQTVSAVLCLRHLTAENMTYRLRREAMKIDKRLLREILRCGVPSGIQNSVISFANVLVQTNINSFGADAMAGCGAYSKLEGFVFLPVSSYSMALTTYVSQNLGAGEHERAKRGASVGILTACILSELIGGAMYLAAEPLIGIFNASPSVVAFGAQQIRQEALFYFLLSFDHCVAGVCRGAGKANIPMIYMLSIWCVGRIGYITVAMRLCHEIRLLFWAYPLTWGISGILFLAYYLRSDWVHALDRMQENQPSI